MDDNHRGEVLRIRRDGLRPEGVGMASYGARRVAGPRREEVAVLAGVNADCYTRLGQGRERNPAPQVVDALSRALHLDADARAHLYRLGGAAPNDQPSVHAAERVSPPLRQLMDGYQVWIRACRVPGWNEAGPKAVTALIQAEARRWHDLADEQA